MYFSKNVYIQQHNISLFASPHILNNCKTLQENKILNKKMKMKHKIFFYIFIYLFWKRIKNVNSKKKILKKIKMKIKFKKLSIFLSVKKFKNFN